jgi:uncharacterized protein YprB with RNaseH-like and TPR domain
LKRRPEGKDLEKFADLWYAADHQGKIDLCEKTFGVPYNVGRHWVSDAGLTRKKEVMETPKEEEKKAYDITNILNTRPVVNLDFVMFDLETSGFDADWDILLTACIKPFGCAPITFRADDYPEWSTKRAYDRQMTIDIAEELKKHAIVVGHYSKHFDIKFLRAKMFRHNLPVLPPMFGIDTWKIAFDNFKISSRRMSNIATFTGLDKKEEVDGTRWMRAAFNGERDAMTKILEHNILDCSILENVASMCFPLLKSLPRL